MNVRWIFLMIVVCAALGRSAQAADPQKERIIAERAAANAKFAAQRRDCESRFVVASCMEAAHKEQRATLSRLHLEELELDDARRRSAGAAREQELREKSQAQQARASEPASAPRRESAREPPQPHAPIEAPKLPRLKGSIPGAASAASSADRRSIEEQNEAKFDAKERALQSHRLEVEQRNAQRAAQGKVPPPLPLPQGAASATP
jgi:colicin import membrane protein